VRERGRERVFACGRESLAAPILWAQEPCSPHPHDQKRQPRSRRDRRRGHRRRRRRRPQLGPGRVRGEALGAARHFGAHVAGRSDKRLGVDDRDRALVPRRFEHHDPLLERKQGVVRAAADVGAGVELTGRGVGTVWEEVAADAAPGAAAAVRAGGREVALAPAPPRRPHWAAASARRGCRPACGPTAPHAHRAAACRARRPLSRLPPPPKPRTRVPSWRTMMPPALTGWPPYTLMPRR